MVFALPRHTLEILEILEILESLNPNTFAASVRLSYI